MVNWGSVLDWVAPKAPSPVPQFAEENALGELLRQKEAHVKSMHKDMKSKQDLWSREREVLVKRLKEITIEQRSSLDHTEKWRKAHEAVTEEHRRTLAEKQREVTGLLKESRQKTELLDARSLELTAAQAFLSKADTISEADVLEIVNDLNAQILQIAASLTDDWEGHCCHAIRPEIVHQVESMYGTIFALELGRRNPEMLQMAFQFAALQVFQRISAIWDFQATDTTLQFDNIYATIYASEEQPVAGRWRALTRKNIQGCMNPRELADLSRDLADEITQHIVLVMFCAGLFNDFDIACRYVTQKCGKKISAGIVLALRLNKILGCEITSVDLKLMYPSPGATFDPLSMEDEYAGVGNNGLIPSPVFVVTELGVAKRVKIPYDGGQEVKESVLLPAKVVLNSVLSIHDSEERKQWSI